MSPRSPLAAASPELRAAYDLVDWSRTSLGPVETWSRSLVDTVDLMMHSRFPMTLLWGPDFALVYNDAYVELIGEKHPSALGGAAREVFGEAWEQIGPWMEAVASTGEAKLVEEALVPLERHGFLEECYFTFSYSAVRGPEGDIEGVLDVATDTTRAVLGRRRLESLGRLADSLAGVGSLDDLRRRTLRSLHAFGADFSVVELQLAGEIDEQWSSEVHGPSPRELLAGEVVVETSSDGLRTAWVALESDRDDIAVSTLMAELNPHVPLDDDLHDFIRLAGSVVGRALSRTRAGAVERAHLDQERRLSETLQRSLLSSPVQQPGLQVAVRYLPAAEEAQVGGDWYDAFELPGGDLCLAIGDVTGHDREAAAGMAQLRNMLRGVAVTIGDAPAAVLGSVDRAVQQLEMDVLATAVAARVGRRDDGSAALSWSSAGHPPPFVITPDGTARILEGKPDPLIGIGEWDRVDHHESLAPGSIAVLFTDGLVERRGASIDDGFTWLEEVLTGRQHLDPEALCDELIAHVPPGIEDDVALLVLRVGSVPAP
ncbi:SpoIIE family protein phosphatase [Aeromicrobium sp. Leaf350]|uniref:SpoIIE family protein phosphatase n=1 Tax=Aeromicrobium sp. Leaf350 TaxID=2876565 RepID=UPI001E5F16E7|nr:SpoIIE family protein phosphatase [Aeromicrobium sp. Leaf350]